MKINQLLLALLVINLFTVSAYTQVPSNLSGENNKTLFKLDQNTQQYIEKDLNSINFCFQRMEELVEVKKVLLPIVDHARQSYKEVKILRQLLKETILELSNSSGGIYSNEEEKSEWENRGYIVTKTNDKSLNGQLLNPNSKESTQKILLSEAKAAKIKKELATYIEKIDSKLSELSRLYISGVRFDEYNINKLKENLFLTKKEENWEKETFGQSTVFSAICLLHQLDHELTMSAKEILSFYEANLGQKDISFDQFDIVLESNTPSVKLGETYEARILLGTFSTQAAFYIKVNDEPLTIKDGQVIYKVKPTKKGVQTFKASISFVNKLTGENNTLRKEFQYEVK